METTRQQEPTQLSIRRRYPVAPEKVWRAWTEPQALSQWFGHGATPSVTTAEIDLRAGGRYRIAFSTPDGDTHEVSGVYQEVVSRRRLVFTWAWKSTPERVSRVSIDLKPLDDGTELSFVHDRFFDAAARANHERGWVPFLAKLDEFLRLDMKGA
ncbi:MAG: SRPBCC domain-containing protein [Burkholderiales bacterium]